MSQMKPLAKKVDQNPLLVVLCGPSHAGKTTFARRLSETGGNFKIISPDRIRNRISVGFRDPTHENKVWEIYESTKCKALKEGRNIILDACHISEKARWHALQGPNESHRKICIVFDLPFKTIRERCLNEKRVSLEEVRRMWKNFQENKPTPKELKHQGFDEMYFIKECPVYGPVHVIQPDKKEHSAGISIKGDGI